MAELVVYGRSSCSACTRFKGSCEHGGLKYRFADIDVAENKAEMLRKLRAAEWFKGGKCLVEISDRCDFESGNIGKSWGLKG